MKGAIERLNNKLWFFLVLMIAMSIGVVASGESNPATCVLMSDGVTPVNWPECVDPSDAATWTISADTYCHDGEIILCNNLSVNGGRFNLNNIIMMFNGSNQANGTQRFKTFNTATNKGIYINDSTINITGSRNHPYIVLDSSYVEIRNTNFSRLGKDGSDGDIGISAYNNSVVWINNTFHDFAGRFTDNFNIRTGCTFIGNTFYNNGMPDSNYVFLSCNVSNYSNNNFLDSNTVYFYGINNSVIENNKFFERVLIGTRADNIKINNNNMSSLNASKPCIDFSTDMNRKNINITNNYMGNCSYAIFSTTNIRYVNISNNIIERTWVYSFSLTNFTDGFIINNTINQQNQTYTIYMDRNYNMTLSFNNISNTGSGIFYYRSQKGLINNNWINNCTKWDNGCYSADQTNYTQFQNNICYNGNRSCYMAAESINISFSGDKAFCDWKNGVSKQCQAGFAFNAINLTIYNVSTLNYSRGVDNQRTYHGTYFINNLGGSGYSDISFSSFLLLDTAGLYFITTNNTNLHDNILTGANSSSLYGIYMSNNTANNLIYNNRISNVITAIYEITNTKINSSNDVFDTSKVSVDATSSLDKWVDVGVVLDYPLGGVGVVLGNSSVSLSGSTDASGSTSTVRLVQYQNIGGTARTYVYDLNYTSGAASKDTRVTMPTNNYAVPYYFVLSLSGWSSVGKFLCGTAVTLAWCVLLFLMFWIPLRAGQEFKFSVELLVYLIVAVAIIVWMINFSYGVCGV